MTPAPTAEPSDSEMSDLVTETAETAATDSNPGDTAPADTAAGEAAAPADTAAGEAAAPADTAAGEAAAPGDTAAGEAAAATDTTTADDTAAASGDEEVAGVAGAPTDEQPAPAVVPAARRLGADRPVLTVGRRKRAIVRVRLISGTGQFSLNGRSLDSYFPNKVHQQLIKEPLTALDRVGSFDVIARLSGGGVTGQAGALRLGIARALIEVDETDRPALKKAGFLTRDARVKERKKYGLKKARKAPQYSKR